MKEGISAVPEWHESQTPSMSRQAVEYHLLTEDQQ